MELSQHTVNYLVGLANIDPDREVCGLILRNQTVHPILNIAQFPDRSFEMDPVQLLEAITDFTADRPGDKIMGIYHSHPNGRQGPSKVDGDSWTPDGWDYWIIARGVVLEWRKTGDEFTLVWAKSAVQTKELAGSTTRNSGGLRPAD